MRKKINPLWQYSIGVFCGCTPDERKESERAANEDTFNHYSEQFEGYIKDGNRIMASSTYCMLRILASGMRAGHLASEGRQVVVDKMTKINEMAQEAGVHP